MPLTFNPKRTIGMSHIHVTAQGQRSLGSKDKVETSGRTERRTEPIAFPTSLTRLTMIWSCKTLTNFVLTLLANYCMWHHWIKKENSVIHKYYELTYIITTTKTWRHMHDICKSINRVTPGIRCLQNTRWQTHTHTHRHTDGRGHNTFLLAMTNAKCVNLWSTWDSCTHETLAL